MRKVTDYLSLIHQLEQQKWDLIAKHGQVGARFWPPIDAKLDKLYKWYTKDYLAGNAKPRPFNPRVLK